MFTLVEATFTDFECILAKIFAYKRYRKVKSVYIKWNKECFYGSILIICYSSFCCLLMFSQKSDLMSIF
jgi:hypothetical protein